MFCMLVELGLDLAPDDGHIWLSLWVSMRFGLVLHGALITFE